jgi:hypothetical protein
LESLQNGISDPNQEIWDDMCSFDAYCMKDGMETPLLGMRQCEGHRDNPPKEVEEEQGQGEPEALGLAELRKDGWEGQDDCSEGEELWVERVVGARGGGGHKSAFGQGVGLLGNDWFSA